MGNFFEVTRQKSVRNPSGTRQERLVLTADKLA